MRKLTTTKFRAPRSACIVRATNQQEASSTRRQMLGLAGVSALVIGAQKAQAVDIELKRWEKVGLDYQNNDRDSAMDIDIPQNERDGFTQAREAKDFTKARLMESKSRIENDLVQYINANRWETSRAELRRQLGNLSLDMNTLIAASSDKKGSAALKKEFFTEIDSLDFSLRKKNEEKALKYQASAVSKLNDFISKVG
eukprot:CAMPEP_0198241492 /NCGR_PEP_ID=MMETSP1446-20131203/6302_1 /TAXON_ID=1461542 ORGANISM="Unidentified sp, Strain CCMP2111" /NCGR_SAMPLE_ID=MMETSP1446 /ASSEMBLY_ACC=CAM_ASM_001112 /LENGTH=197 /DNA_ID=CAMNT_0043924347 /DNA_START=124 /DNA_END=717 /DNA_ORIENTATION=-